jgi:hypothetical protein
MSVLDELTDDYERADALVHLLIDRATGASALNDRVRFSDEATRAPLRVAAKLVIVVRESRSAI